jgi:hypothetical protein
MERMAQRKAHSQTSYVLLNASFVQARFQPMVPRLRCTPAKKSIATSSERKKSPATAGLFD